MLQNGLNHTKVLIIEQDLNKMPHVIAEGAASFMAGLPVIWGIISGVHIALLIITIGKRGWQKNW
jgi:hypothetical protein